MVRTQTRFMGIDMPSPIIVGSSGLTNSAEQIGKLAAAGAGAIVLKSLFEEQILMQIEREAGRGGVVYGQAAVDDFVGYYERKHSIDAYFTLIREAKKRSPIPILASVNAVSAEQWTQIASDIADAGADGIQLNMFVSPFAEDRSSDEIESVYIEAIGRVKEIVSLPVAVKIGPNFTNLRRFAARLVDAGADALVMFNRFYQPDISLETLAVGNAAFHSSGLEYPEALRWTAILAPRLGVPIAAAGGIHDGATAIKMIVAGATVVEVVSTLYKNGSEQIGTMIHELDSWMEQRGYPTLEEVRGVLSSKNYDRPDLFERVQYMRYYGDLETK